LHHVIAQPDTFRHLITEIGSGAAAVLSACAAILGAINRAHISEVRVRINGELHGNITKLAESAARLESVTKERDALVVVAQSKDPAVPSTATEVKP
jgi:hypothetical protein